MYHGTLKVDVYFVWFFYSFVFRQFFSLGFSYYLVLNKNEQILLMLTILVIMKKELYASSRV